MAEARVTGSGPRRPRGGKPGGVRSGAKNGRSGKADSKSPYFLQPAKGAQVAVLRRPCGNRAEPKVCGVMPSRALALALVKQLSRAESAVDDLFLEATDDGIEALEAILDACCKSVLARPASGGTAQPGGVPQNGAARKQGRRRRGRSGRGSGPVSGEAA